MISDPTRKTLQWILMEYIEDWYREENLLVVCMLRRFTLYCRGNEVNQPVHRLLSLLPAE